MQIVTVGKVVVAARIEHLTDVLQASAGGLSESEIRAVSVDDALVDTGATLLSLPIKLIVQLGLRCRRRRTPRTPAGILSFGIYEPVQLTVQDRQCVIEVAELRTPVRC